MVQVKEEMPFPKHPAVVRLSGAELLRGLEEPMAVAGLGANRNSMRLLLMGMLGHVGNGGMLNMSPIWQFQW